MSQWIGMLAQMDTVTNWSNTILQVVVKGVLAVAGFFLGALATGLLVWVIVRLSTPKKMPKWLFNLIRAGGGILVGWLAVILIHVGGGGGGFGLGGSGWGGTGGSGSGTGNGTNDKNFTSTNPRESERPREKDQNNDKSGGPQVLKVEVLSDKAVKRIKGEEAIKEKRFYRVRQKDGPRLLTLEEVKKVIVPNKEPAYQRHLADHLP